MRKSLSTMFLTVFLLVPVAAFAQGAPAKAKADVAGAVSTPPKIVWETDNDEPLFGSPKAIRGGTFNSYLDAYPLTLRVMGPNSTDVFANWNQQFSVLFTLVQMHPVTDKFIPMMATAWSVQPDRKTIYYKLDPDARFSDGHKITADDYVFTWKMMQSRFIVDPFWNNFVKQYYQSVEKIDDYTLKVVGTHPSWRPLYDYGNLWPTPAYATHLDKDWVTRTTNQPQIVPGPYVVSSMENGRSVTFTRVPNWWGDKKRYFQGLYNFDTIHLMVIPDVRALDYLRLGQLDLNEEPTAATWNEQYTFPAVTNGWLHRVRVFNETPQGMYGLIMNTQAPIFQNRNFRIALEYLFNFPRLNRDLMYNSYYRQVSFFEGTEFANPNLKPYPFDPAKAAEYLARAGYHRPASVRNKTFWGKLKNIVLGLLFTRSDTDDILVNDKGEKASFTLTYTGAGIERHLTVLQQDFRRAGVDVQLQQLEGGTMFERALQRKFEMTLFGMTATFYPDPRQYLGSEFKKSVGNNDFFGFGTPQVDALIKTYEDSLDADARQKAMYQIDQIVHDEALYIPFWTAPYDRIAYWDYIQFPDFYLPKRASNIIQAMDFWIDPAKKAALEEAMKTGKAYPVDKDIDKDFYNVRKNLQ